MIIDYFFPNGFDFVEEPHLYLRTRDENGTLQSEIITPQDKRYISPFCWIPVETPRRYIDRVQRMFTGLEVHWDVRAEGRDGVQLMKVTVPNPSQLWKLKDQMRTYEADVPYEDQVLLHMFPDRLSMPEFHPRVWYFDLEWDVNTDATTVMAVDDTHAEHPIVFAWSQESEGQDGVTVDFIDREGGYERRLYGSEGEMHDAFLDHLDECDPDILIAHAIAWADLPHLMRRLTEPDRLSPVGNVIRPHVKNGYKETAQPITGRLILDTAAKGSTGSGIESLWIKSGRGNLPNRKLQTIAEELGLSGKIQQDEDGNKLDVRTWWYTHFDLFVDYCLVDTTELRKICEMINFVPFFTTVQRFCGVQMKSTHRVTNYLRGMFGRYTDLKAPSSFRYNREHLKAANVFAKEGGLYEGVLLGDFASLYPQIMIGANLCPTTKYTGTPREGILTMPDGSMWLPSSEKKGILPTIMQDLLELRKEYKGRMYEATSEDERLKWDMMQLAVKILANAAYGYVSQSKVGGMWTDPDVGGAITSMGRKAIDTLASKAEEKGYKVLAGHTDSSYIQVPFDEVDALIEHLNETIQAELLPTLIVEAEAYFDYFFIGSSKNRNFGIIQWPESKKGHLKVTGFEHKSANASPITKQIQNQIFHLVGSGATESEVSEIIRPIALKLKKGEYTANELAPYGRLGKAQYERVPPNAAKGAIYYNDHLATNDPIRVFDSAQWLYVNEVPKGKPYTNIVSYREESEVKDFSIDYDTMVNKFIKAKIQPIYDVLGWDVGYACGDKVPKKYW